MFKKLVLAGLAVFIGTAVIRHTSLGSFVHVMWKDARQAVERQVPPEVQIRQLQVEVDKIDRDIKDNLSKLARQEVDCEALDANVASLKDAQAALKAEIVAMAASLDAKTDKVAFKGKPISTGALARKLDNATTLYESKRGELKSKEQLLGSKKQALEAAHARIGEMRDQKDKLRVTVGQLEARLQLARLNATRTNVELDDSQVTRCKQLADSIAKRLALEEKEQELQSQYGFRAELPHMEKDAKPTADVLKAAKKALEEDEAGDRVAGNK
jgi:chromosome segregation ATPase